MAAVPPVWVQLGSPVNPGLGDLLDTLTGGHLEDAVEILEATRAILNATSATVQDFAILLAVDDPIGALLGALAQIATNTIRDLRKTGLYLLPLAPPRLTDVLRPYPVQTAMFDAALSLSDYLDSQRPDLGGEGAYAGIAVLFSATQWFDFLQLLGAFDAVFGSGASQWARFADLRLRVQETKQQPRGSRQSAGTTWDWSSVTLGDGIPVLGQILSTIEAILAPLAAGTSALGQMLSEASAILAERLQAISSLLDTVARLAAFLAALKALLLRGHWLPLVSDRGGSDELAAQLISSQNAPPDQFCAGLIVLAAGPNPYVDVEAFLDLLGVEQAVVRRTFSRARARFEAL